MWGMSPAGCTGQRSGAFLSMVPAKGRRQAGRSEALPLLTARLCRAQARVPLGSRLVCVSASVSSGSHEQGEEEQNPQHASWLHRCHLLAAV